MSSPELDKGDDPRAAGTPRQARPEAAAGGDAPSPSRHGPHRHASPRHGLPRHRLHRRAARHVGRGAHHVLRWVAAVAAVLILAVLFGLWRLMQGPVELNWATPYVEAAIAHSGVGLKVAISGVRFGIDRASRRLELRAEDVGLTLPDGQPVAQLPELAISFTVGRLLRGDLEPSRVVVERPLLRLVRNANGAISARIGAASGGSLGPRLLEEMAGPPAWDAPLGLVRRLSVRGATLVVDDRVSGRTWRLDDVDLSINRRPKGARGEVSLAVPLGTSRPELYATYRYFAKRQVLDLKLAVDGVEPTALPPLIPELAQLRHIAAPVSGTLQTRIDLKLGRAQGSRLDLGLGKGRLHSDWLPHGSIAIAGGELHATYAPEADEIRVRRLALDLGDGTRLAIDGVFGDVTPALIAASAGAPPPGHVSGRFAARLTHVPVARFGRLWPPALSPGARRWTLDNVRDGTLDEARMQIALDLDPAAHTGRVVSATGQLRYHDLAITYLKGLPPVRKVAGTARFAGDTLTFTPTTGSLEGLAITGGALRLTELGTPTEWLTIDLDVAGPLHDVLSVIDNEPLHYAHAIGLDPAQVGGHARARLHFRLPLLDDLKLADVAYRAKATLSRVRVGKLAFGRSLTRGRFGLDLDPAGAHLWGTGHFDGVRTKLDARLPFAAAKSRAGPSRAATARVAMTLGPAAQRRLGIDLPPDRVAGPIAVTARYTALSAARGEAVLTLNLTGAALAIAEAGWHKPPGQPGRARIVLDLDHEHVTRVRAIAVTAPGLDGQFTAELGPRLRRLDRVDIRRLVVGNSDFTGVVSRRAQGGWRADIRGARLDASHLFEEATSGAPAPPSPGATPLEVHAAIGRLILGPHRELRQVRSDFVYAGGVWQSGHLDGRFADGHRLRLRFGEAGSRRLLLRSDDLGATMRLLDVASNIVGGTLKLDGQLSEAAGRRVLHAHVEGQNYVIRKAPGLARLLAVPSLTGFASLLSGSGLPFMGLKSDIVYSDNRVTLSHLVAYGEALGITAEGWIDGDSNRLDLRGTIAPVNVVNLIIDHVPLIGPLLGGGAQGLIAANFRLNGPTHDPHLTVNPLSALTPGILRRIFAPIVGVPAPAPPPPRPPLTHPPLTHPPLTRLSPPHPAPPHPAPPSPAPPSPATAHAAPPPVAPR